jgi:hypothetical protein
VVSCLRTSQPKPCKHLCPSPMRTTCPAHGLTLLWFLSVNYRT